MVQGSYQGKDHVRERIMIGFLSGLGSYQRNNQGRSRYLLDVVTLPLERLLSLFFSTISQCLELLLIWNLYVLHDRPISNGRQGPSTKEEQKDNNQETGSKCMPHLLHLHQNIDRQC